MNLCVSDEKVIINIQGIRSVTWGVNSSYNRTEVGSYFITVTYKGSHNVFYYQTEEAAKAIFNKIREAMDKSIQRS